jgi:hypothetical protein
MSYTQTPNLGLMKPTPNSDTGTWGYHLNANADILDQALVMTNLSAAMTAWLFSLPTAPQATAGWWNNGGSPVYS